MSQGSRYPIRIVLSIAIAALVGGCYWMPQAGIKADSRTDANVVVTEAQALAAQGDLDAALIEFNRAIAINPRLGSAHIGAAEIHRTNGDYEAAEKNYGTAASIDPKNFDSQYMHGLMLQLLDRATDAVRAYLRALSIQPQNFDANLNLATTYLQLKEPGQAVTYAQRAVELNPENGAARVNLGAVYRGLGRHGDAVTEYQQAAELMELRSELLLNLADSLGHTGRYAEMSNALGQLVKTDPSALAYERMASALFRMGQHDEALVHFNLALELDPGHFPALNGVGVCLLNRYLLSGKADDAALMEAMGALRRSLQIERNQPRVVELLSRYG